MAQVLIQMSKGIRELADCNQNILDDEEMANDLAIFRYLERLCCKVTMMAQ